jgi:HSP20 family protein
LSFAALELSARAAFQPVAFADRIDSRRALPSNALHDAHRPRQSPDARNAPGQLFRSRSFGRRNAMANDNPSRDNPSRQQSAERAQTDTTQQGGGTQRGTSQGSSGSYGQGGYGSSGQSSSGTSGHGSSDQGASGQQGGSGTSAWQSGRQPGALTRGGSSSMAPYFGGYSGYGGGPFSVMRRISEEMDRLFENFGFGRGLFPEMRQGGFDLGGYGERATSMWSPHVEVCERNGKLLIQADLPGMKREDVNVRIDQDQVIIQGERRQQQESQQGGYYRSERSYGSFYRTIPLPEGTNSESATASFRDGVLEIEVDMPRQQQRGRTLEIREGGASGSRSQGSTYSGTGSGTTYGSGTSGSQHLQGSTSGSQQAQSGTSGSQSSQFGSSGSQPASGTGTMHSGSGDPAAGAAGVAGGSSDTTRHGSR